MKRISAPLLVFALACLGCCEVRNYSPAGSQTYFWVPGVGRWLVDEVPVPEQLGEQDQSDPTSNEVQASTKRDHATKD